MPGDRRKELLDARESVQNQIDILDVGPMNGRDVTAQTPVLVDRLKAILEGIDAELVDLEGK